MRGIVTEKSAKFESMQQTVSGCDASGVNFGSGGGDRRETAGFSRVVHCLRGAEGLCCFGVPGNANKERVVGERRIDAARQAARVTS